MRKGNVSSIYLSDYEWELLDKLTRSYGLHNNSEMIRMLINLECERAGYINVDIEKIEKEKLRLQSEINKLNEQAERVRDQNPLVSAREVNLNSEFDDSVKVICRMISRGDSLIDIERVATTRSKVYLKNKWTAEEIIKKANKLLDDRKIIDKEI
jgi:hypothetical protein